LLKVKKELSLRSAFREKQHNEVLVL